MNTQTVTHSLDYGNTTIEYSLNFANRKTLGITVHPDCSVSVVAPRESNIETIEDKLKKRRAWILKQQLDFERYLPHLPARRYISGETHLYLGKQYRLKVVADTIRSVKLSRGYFHLHTANPSDTDSIKNQLTAWYRDHAKRIFTLQLAQCMSRVKSIGITQQPELKIKQMQKRWGSCTSDGTITLNLKLIQVPKHLIDYVIIHELCHIKEHNHSAAYYYLLDRVMPDWRERRDTLNLVKVA